MNIHGTDTKYIQTQNNDLYFRSQKVLSMLGLIPQLSAVVESSKEIALNITPSNQFAKFSVNL